MINLDVITGFLGAGKTTLINRLLAEAYVDEKPVLIENEFGDVSIDDSLIENPDVQVRTLSSGCICCTLKGDFIDGITDIVEKYSPTRIIIEPTGLAEPDEILSICEDACKAVSARINAFITVVNAENLLPLLAVGGELFKKQISGASFLLLNRTGALHQEQFTETLDAIRRLNPDCVILEQDKENRDVLSTLALAEEASNPCPDCESSGCCHEEHCHNGHSHCHDHNKDDITSLAFYPEKSFSQKELYELFEAFSEGTSGRILRAKGFLRSTERGFTHLEYVYGRGEVFDTVYESRPKFVVIGVGLNETALSVLIGGE